MGFGISRTWIKAFMTNTGLQKANGSVLVIPLLREKEDRST